MMPCRYLIILFVLLFVSTAAAEETRIAIRALSKDAKFIGSGMGGMEVSLRDAETGSVLDRGVTTGGTGDTKKIIRKPRERYAPISTDDAAVYRTSLDLDVPRRITVTVRGPLAQPQTRAEVSETRWVLPGQHMDEGDGWLIEVPGFAVDILSPVAHSTQKNETVTVSASVMMLCGCGTEPGGLWDSHKVEIIAHVTRNEEPVAEVPMVFAGETSVYRAEIPAVEPGDYAITVTAFDRRTLNTGVDRASFVRP